MPRDNSYFKFKMREYRINNPDKNILYLARKRASSKNLEIDLDIDFIRKLLKPMKCSVTNIDLKFRDGNKKHITYNMPSIDRIDCSKGYTKDNVQIVAWCYNNIKSTMTDDETIDIILEMADGLRKKDTNT